MLTNNWPGMQKEINSQLSVFLNIMNITGPFVYSARARFTLLHMAEALKRNADLFFLYSFKLNELGDNDSWAVFQNKGDVKGATGKIQIMSLHLKQIHPPTPDATSGNNR